MNSESLKLFEVFFMWHVGCRVLMGGAEIPVVRKVKAADKLGAIALVTAKLKGESLPLSAMHLINCRELPIPYFERTGY
jgi:hypothetical protein